MRHYLCPPEGWLTLCFFKRKIAYLPKLRMPNVVSSLKYFWDKELEKQYSICFSSREKSSKLSNSDRAPCLKKSMILSIWDETIF